MKKLTSYFRHLGKAIYELVRQVFLVARLLAKPFLWPLLWMMKIMRRITSEMYTRKTRTPVWKRKSALGNARVDVAVVVLVVVLGILSLL